MTENTIPIEEAKKRIKKYAPGFDVSVHVNLDPDFVGIGIGVGLTLSDYFCKTYNAKAENYRNAWERTYPETYTNSVPASLPEDFEDPICSWLKEVVPAVLAADQGAKP